MRVSKKLLVGKNAAPHRDSIIWRMKKRKKTERFVCYDISGKSS